MKQVKMDRNGRIESKTRSGGIGRRDRRVRVEIRGMHSCPGVKARSAPPARFTPAQIRFARQTLVASKTLKAEEVQFWSNEEVMDSYLSLVEKRGRKASV